jgi:hypothetical protein
MSSGAPAPQDMPPVGNASENRMRPRVRRMWRVVLLERGRGRYNLGMAIVRRMDEGEAGAVRKLLEEAGGTVRKEETGRAVWKGSLAPSGQALLMMKVRSYC